MTLTLGDLETFDPRAPSGHRQRRFCCPLPPCQDKPRDAAHRSLVVEVVRGLWYCHRCEARGVLQEYRERQREGRPNHPALVRAAFLAHPAARPPDAHPPPETDVPDPCGKGNWQQWWRDAEPIQGTLGERYLVNRGIPIAVARAAQVRFSLRFFGRPAVLCPIRNETGALVAVTGRHTDGLSDPKVHTAGPARLGVFITSNNVWKQEPLVVTEAPIDALSLAAAGQPAIALNGLHWPVWLPRLMAFRHVAIAFDADEAGERTTNALAARLHTVGVKVERWCPRGSKDWNELIRLHGVAALLSALSKEVE